MKNTEKNSLYNIQSIHKFQDYFNLPNICVIGVINWEGEEGIFEEVIIEKFLHLMKL